MGVMSTLLISRDEGLRKLAEVAFGHMDNASIEVALEKMFGKQLYNFTITYGDEGEDDAQLRRLLP
jgi:hypothetical protein